MKSKRVVNTTGLKVKYLGATNLKGARIKFTQLNNKKSCVIHFDYNFEVLDKAFNLLDQIKEIESYSNIVDNIQSNYYLLNISFKGNTFPNIIEEIKRINK